MDPERHDEMCDEEFHEKIEKGDIQQCGFEGRKMNLPLKGNEDIDAKFKVKKRSGAGSEEIDPEFTKAIQEMAEVRSATAYRVPCVPCATVVRSK